MRTIKTQSAPYNVRQMQMMDTILKKKKKKKKGSIFSSRTYLGKLTLVEFYSKPPLMFGLLKSIGIRLSRIQN